MKYQRMLQAVVMWSVLVVMVSIQAQEIPKGRFIRLHESMQDPGLPLSLDTSVASYTNKDGVQIDLIGAIHVADGEYFEKLNQMFEEYDVVAFEMVAPAGADVARRLAERADDSPMNKIWLVIKMAIQLEFQQTGISYDSKNLVHADMSTDEMAEVIKERGDNGLTIGLGVVADMIRQYNLQQLKLERDGPALPSKSVAELQRVAEENLLELIKNPHIVKRVLAEQLATSVDGGLGATLENLLIKDRNAKAMTVVDKLAKDGKKKIAIFYGAAHMPDFEQRLIKDRGFSFQNEKWITAWDLRHSKPTKITLVVELIESIKSALE